MKKQMDYLSRALVQIETATEDFLRDQGLHDKIRGAANLCINAVSAGKKIMVAGNGGSAADAQHFAAELIGRYQAERNPISAIALTVDTSILTAVGNDYSYKYVFSRQIEALCNENDVLLLLSTSGKSENILEALQAAKRKSANVIALSGPTPDAALEDANCLIKVNATMTPRIQEIHQKIYHILAGLIEEGLVNTQ